VSLRPEIHGLPEEQPSRQKLLPSLFGTLPGAIAGNGRTTAAGFDPYGRQLLVHGLGERRAASVGIMGKRIPQKTKTMKKLKNLMQDFTSLAIPDVCQAYGVGLNKQKQVLCTDSRFQLPYTYFRFEKDV